MMHPAKYQAQRRKIAVQAERSKVHGKHHHI
jgi:hypothetical protein